MKITSTDHMSFIASGAPGFNSFQSYDNYDVRTHHMDTRDHATPEDIRQPAMVTASFAWQSAMLSTTCEQATIKGIWPENSKRWETEYKESTTLALEGKPPAERVRELANSLGHPNL